MPSLAATWRASWMSWPAQQAPVRCVARAVVVELQRHADDVVAGLLDEPGDDGGIDAARHGDDDARRGTRAREAEIDIHHCKLLRTPQDYNGRHSAGKGEHTAKS